MEETGFARALALGSGWRVGTWMKISRPLAAAILALAPWRVRQLAVRWGAWRDGCHDALLLLHERLSQRCEGSSHCISYTRSYSSHVCASVFYLFFTFPLIFVGVSLGALVSPV